MIRDRNAKAEKRKNDPNFYENELIKNQIYKANERANNPEFKQNELEKDKEYKQKRRNKIADQIRNEDLKKIFGKDKDHFLKVPLETNRTFNYNSLFGEL